MSFSKEVSVIVPVYNAAGVLKELVQRIEATLSPRYKFELMFVNDASTDDSAVIIADLCAKHYWISALTLERNVGQHAALLTGLRFAKYNVAVTMDDDLQHKPESIPHLLNALSDEVDLVYAKPANNFDGKYYRVMVTAVKLLISVAARAPHIRNMSSFRAFKTAIYPWNTINIVNNRVFDGLLTPVRPKVRIIFVEYKARSAGSSSYNLFRSARLAYTTWKSARLPYPVKTDI